MTSTKDLLRPLDRIVPPDLTHRIGEPPMRGPIDLEPHRRHPVLAAVAALIVTGLIVGVSVTAFEAEDPPVPGGPSMSPADLAAMVEAMTTLQDADAILQDAIESGDEAEIDDRTELVDEAISELRALVRAAPNPPVGENAPIEDQISALIRAKADRTIEWVEAGTLEGSEGQALREGLSAQLEAIGDAIEDRCLEVDPTFAEAAGCDVTAGGAGGGVALVSLEHSGADPTATLSYREAERDGIPVEILSPGPMIDDDSAPGGILTSFLGWSSASADIDSLDEIDPEFVPIPAAARIESGGEELILLAFAQAGEGQGWNVMTPLPVPTDLQMLDAGTPYLFVVVGRGNETAAPQFAFAVELTEPTDTQG